MKHLQIFLIVLFTAYMLRVTPWHVKVVKSDWRFRDLKQMGIRIERFELWCYNGYVNVVYPNTGIYLPFFTPNEQLCKCK